MSRKLRWGIFGGTFNPFHNAHLDVFTTAQKKAELDRVTILLAKQNPLKSDVEIVPAHHRLKMLEIALQDYNGMVGIDDREIHREGVSYTIDSVKEIAQEQPDADLYLILGMDTFETFDKWKDFEELLTYCHLVVASRPGIVRPFSVDEMPKGLKPLISAFDGRCAVLETGKSIEFINIGNLPFSSTEVRKKLKTGQNVDKFLDIRVEEYINEHNLYAPVGPRIGDYHKFTLFCAEHLNAKKAINVKAFQLPEHSTLADFSIVASGTSTRQASALAEILSKAVKSEFGVTPISVEGMAEGRWVVLDYGALIVHIFYDYLRQQYNLEELWSEGKELPLSSNGASL